MRRDQLGQLVANAGEVTPVRHSIGEPPAHAELFLGLAQQQGTAVRGMVAAIEIGCEFLAAGGLADQRAVA